MVPAEPPAVADLEGAVPGEEDLEAAVPEEEVAAAEPAAGAVGSYIIPSHPNC